MKAILVRAQKSRKALEKASVTLEIASKVINRMLVEMWRVKVMLMESQMVMSSTLKTRGKKQLLLYGKELLGEVRYKVEKKSLNKDLKEQHLFPLLPVV